MLWFHPIAEHLTFALLDDWSKEAAWRLGRTRVTRPARVTDPTIGNPALGLVHDRAYWISSS